MIVKTPERAEVLHEGQAAVFHEQFPTDVCSQVAGLVGSRLTKKLATVHMRNQAEGVHTTELDLRMLKYEWRDIDRFIRASFAFAREVIELPPDWADRSGYWPMARGHVLDPGAKIGMHNKKMGLQGVAMLIGLAGTVDVGILPIPDGPSDPTVPRRQISTSLHPGDVLVLDAEIRPWYEESNSSESASTHIIVFERPAGS